MELLEFLLVVFFFEIPANLPICNNEIISNLDIDLLVPLCLNKTQIKDLKKMTDLLCGQNIV
jgi:hypothetical protein